MEFHLVMDGWAMAFRFESRSERERVHWILAGREESLGDNKCSGFEFDGPDQTYDLILVGKGSLDGQRRQEITTFCMQEDVTLNLDRSLVEKLAARHFGYCSGEELSTVGCTPENQPTSSSSGG